MGVAMAAQVWVSPAQASPRAGNASSPVAASVTAGDRRARKAVRQAFLDLGFEAAEADLRAQLTFAAGMGFLQMANNSAHPMPVAQRERVLDFMTRP